MTGADIRSYNFTITLPADTLLVSYCSELGLHSIQAAGDGRDESQLHHV
jgi:hypothetical protein